MLTTSGHAVAALAVVNALGSPTIGDGPWFWAAPYEVTGEYGGRGLPPAFDTSPKLKGGNTGTATTIGVVVTEAVLTRSQCKRLAIMAHDGLARAILPAHAPLDGDTIFAASTGNRLFTKSPIEMTELGHAATLVMARAIARGVYEATALPVTNGQMTWRQKFGLQGVD